LVWRWPRSLDPGLVWSGGAVARALSAVVHGVVEALLEVEIYYIIENFVGFA